MLHDSPDLVIHSTEIWAAWRPYKLGAKKFGVSWRSSSTVACAWRSVLVHCPTGAKSLPDTLRIAGIRMTSLSRREAAQKKLVKGITRISCFVTTMKLPHDDCKNNSNNINNKCVSKTDTNPPFAFQIAFPRGTDFAGFLHGESKSRDLQSEISVRIESADSRLQLQC